MSSGSTECHAHSKFPYLLSMFNCSVHQKVTGELIFWPQVNENRRSKHVAPRSCLSGSQNPFLNKKSLFYGLGKNHPPLCRLYDIVLHFLWQWYRLQSDIGFDKIKKPIQKRKHWQHQKGSNIKCQKSKPVFSSGGMKNHFHTVVYSYFRILFKMRKWLSWHLCFVFHWVSHCRTVLCIWYQWTFNVCPHEHIFC